MVLCWPGVLGCKNATAQSAWGCTFHLEAPGTRGGVGMAGWFLTPSVPLANSFPRFITQLRAAEFLKPNTPTPPPAEAGTDGSAPSQGSRGSSPVGHICSHPASLCSAWLLSFLCIQHTCLWLYVVTSAQSPAWDFPAAGTAIPVL